MSKQHTTHKFATTTGTGRHVILDLDGSLANAYAVFSAPPELGRSFGYAKVVLPMHEVPQFGRDSKTGLVGLEALAYATSYDGKDSGRNPLELNTRSRSHDAHVQTWSGDRDCRVTMICSGVSRQTGSYLGMIIDLDGCSDADMQEINRLRWHGTAAEVQAKAYEVLAKLRAQA